MTNKKEKHHRPLGVSILAGGIILFIVLTVIYNIRNYWPGVSSAGFNVNYGMKAVDSVWLNEGNPYHNDALIYTIIKDKETVFNGGSWYADYLKVFSGSSSEDNALPKFVSPDELDTNDFSEVGHFLAYIHATLVDHQVSNLINAGGEVPKLYVHTDGIADAERITVLNDEQGNLYLMSEEYWNEVSD